MEFRRLSRDDDTSLFRCGEPALDEFLRRYAKQNQFKHQLGVSWVLVEDARICAFLTVSGRSLTLPEPLRRGLPRYPLPTLLIARMGVHQEDAGRGLGARLLREAFGLALQKVELDGCVGVTADAKPGSVGFYRRFGFVPIEEPDETGLQMHFVPLRHLRELKQGP
ncbi:MAG: GNAT family N-acetyltransferase [Deltaproteobacteria bacterium]|nr:GNAT family N-acetyltransferase [Deltaproteobacteria bacterium]